MKHTWIFALLFAAAAGFAQEPTPAALTAESLIATSNRSGAGGSCTMPESRPLSACTATAICELGTVSCQGTSSCSSSDSQCSLGGIKGYATCDGVTTWCPNCACGDPHCCFCEQSEDCWSCCLCRGGSTAVCNRACT